MKVVIRVFLKEGVLDPQGKAIEKALYSLNFTKVSDVKVSKEISFKLDETDKNKALEQAKAMCEELLANTVIENYEILI
ncbi:phosphoribosylformylglycinamidine synthase [Campylobacter sp. MIT 99-7217]|uniref:phosphoribosylformylglycinamidine synthase subunit PurS n=1 Tax=Campylobacter sp. MIT 99-7217 TaxID=535091 RepID=UPI00115B4614|nr:phosphoribosylformylglycinamidine synthase subunit PurS [Campylobacter sp. MIT 99-7217]TQR33038.1 phosphoribosylformylglycinamidine synthase [Campylobacter sp. MIT 99-7217]